MKKFKIGASFLLLIFACVLMKNITLLLNYILALILHELAHIELNQLNQIDQDIAFLKIDEYEDAADKYINFLLSVIKEKF